jgi:CheY-like chemotaxis protein
LAAKSPLTFPSIRLARTNHKEALASNSDSPERRGVGEGARPRRRSQKGAKQFAKRIAVVDDEEELCSAFSMLLESLGHRLDFVAHDGTEIVEAVVEGGVRPDLIMMDYRMPVMNGLRAAEIIRTFRPETKIVVVTGDDSVKPRALAAGLLFLQKPFSVWSLRAAIDDSFDDSKSAGGR